MKLQFNELDSKLEAVHCQLNSFQLLNIKLPDKFDAAIQLTEVTRQNIATAQQQQVQGLSLIAPVLSSFSNYLLVPQLQLKLKLKFKLLLNKLQLLQPRPTPKPTPPSSKASLKLLPSSYELKD